MSPFLVQQYIYCSGQLFKSPEDKLLSQIFENKNNRFILNTKLVNQYESQFPAQSNELDIFQQQFAELINNRGISKSATKSILKDILVETEQNYLADKNDSEIYLNLSNDNNDSCEGTFSAYFTKAISEKLKDYLYFNLAAHNPNPLTYWHYEFKTDNEIKNFFHYIYSLFIGDEIDIFDAYVNLTHPYYEPFLGKNHKINYYTAYIPQKKIVEKINLNKELIAYFKRVFIFRAQHSKYIHERRIKFNNLTIEINNDPANLLIAEPTWKIDI